MQTKCCPQSQQKRIVILILCLERVLSSFTVARPAALQRRGFLRKLMANRHNDCNLLVKNQRGIRASDSSRMAVQPELCVQNENGRPRLCQPEISRRIVLSLSSWLMRTAPGCCCSHVPALCTADSKTTPNALAPRIARPGFVPSAIVEFSNSLATK